MITELQQMFENSRDTGLFTDYDFCVQGQMTEKFSGGKYVSQGSTLFDVASLTKACSHLLFLRLFFGKVISPEDKFEDFFPVPNASSRQLWHFLCYTVKDYNFSYEALRNGTIGPFRDVLLKSGFGPWGKRFQYENLSSACLAFVLENLFNTGIEQILQQRLLFDQCHRNRFTFNPVRKGLIEPGIVVPTRTNLAFRGLVHDPLSFNHPGEDLSVAGLFSDAETLAKTFHFNLDPIINTQFYTEVAVNQLTKLKIVDRKYALGLDIPNDDVLREFEMTGGVEFPLIFRGYTGCRIFFCRKPRVTICFLTNRVFCGDAPESRLYFSKFSWSVIKEVVRRALSE